MIFDKNKKVKDHAKIKWFTLHLLLFSLIFLVTFHTIFAYLYFALFQYFHDVWLKNTPNLEMAVWSRTLPSLFFFFFSTFLLFSFICSCYFIYCPVLYFYKKTESDISCQLSPWRQLAWNVICCFLGKIRMEICMKCHVLFSGKSRKISSICHHLKQPRECYRLKCKQLESRDAVDNLLAHTIWHLLYYHLIHSARKRL